VRCRGCGRADRDPAGRLTIEARVGRLLGCDVVEAARLAGGDLSAVYRIRLADGRTCVAKSGETARSEARMLAAIRATGAPTPRVLAVGDGLLVMTMMASDGSFGNATWSSLADALRRLHRPGDEPYGWHEDYRFGTVAIGNARRDDWPGFWAEHRLRCHLDRVDLSLGRRLDRLARALPDMLPRRPASSLLHGDLWGGNVLAGADGAIALIDPACYYGDREVDVAMLTLFDRPPSGFFDRLDLDPDWRARLPIYRLWPLLVHLRPFGGVYAGQVDRALSSLGV
jgi:fructosamine-3-kinase